VLGVVNFDLNFQYALTGWEVIAHDGKVLQDGLKKGLRIPASKYYLEGAGYLKLYFLTPYHGVCYCLKDFARGKDNPQNKEELLNIQHSCLCSAIEPTFRVVKKRFTNMKTMHTHGYSFPMQANIVQCIFLVHNFIHFNQGYDFFSFDYLECVQLTRQSLETHHTTPSCRMGFTSVYKRAVLKRTRVIPNPPFTHWSTEWESNP
jgi:hypothetical protein